MPAKSRKNTKKTDKSSKDSKQNQIDLTSQPEPEAARDSPVSPELAVQDQPPHQRPIFEEPPQPPESSSKKLVLPYPCLKITTELKKQTSRFIQALTDKMGDQLEENKDFENLDRVTRRLKNYVNEILTKVEDKCEFRPNFGKETEEVVEEPNMDLVNENKVLLKKLNDITEQIVSKKTIIEHSFIKDIEVALENAILPPDRITDANYKIKSKGNTMHFDAFLDKYIDSQRQYSETISKAAGVLEANFESLKVNAMKRFKSVIVEHTKLENALKNDIHGTNEAEALLLRD